MSDSNGYKSGLRMAVAVENAGAPNSVEARLAELAKTDPDDPNVILKDLRTHEGIVALGALVYPKLVTGIRDMAIFVRDCCAAHDLPFTAEGIRQLAAKQQVLKKFFEIFPCEVRNVH